MSLSAICSFALFGASVLAQQYAGEYVAGSLPQRSGSELTYFKIRDPAGGNNDATLINYYSLGSDGQRIKPSNVQRAVIMMSGQRRDAYQYIGYVSPLLRLKQLVLGSNTIINRRSMLWPLPTQPTVRPRTTSQSLLLSLPTTLTRTSPILTTTARARHLLTLLCGTTTTGPTDATTSTRNQTPTSLRSTFSTRSSTISPTRTRSLKCTKS